MQLHRRLVKCPWLFLRTLCNINLTAMLLIENTSLSRAANLFAKSEELTIKYGADDDGNAAAVPIAMSISHGLKKCSVIKT